MKTNPTLQKTARELKRCITRGTVPKKCTQANISIIYSPPCTYFSNASTRKIKMEEKVPENDEIVRACRTTIKHFDPLLWFIKNPNSGENKWTSRKVMKEFMQNTQYHQYTTSYCWYGRDDRKDTFIFKNVPDLKLKDCRNWRTVEMKIVVKEIKDIVTAQAGTSTTADGTITLGSPRKEAQRTIGCTKCKYGRCVASLRSCISGRSHI